MIRKCWHCKQPINFGRYQIGMSFPIMWQHYTEQNTIPIIISSLKAKNPFDICQTNVFLKGLNYILALFRGYKPNDYHGINRDTGEKI